MWKRLFSWFFVFGIVFYSCNPVFAKTIEEEVAELKARITQLEERLGQQENKTMEVEKIAHGAKREFSEFVDYKAGEGIEIKPLGLVIGADATFAAQGTNNANGDDAKNTAEASYSMDLEFEKSFADYGLAFLHLETGDGAGVENNLKVFSNVNRDVDDSDNRVSVTEVWYEHYFKSLPSILTFGKIDPTAYFDTNQYANDECTQFLGRIFRNSPVLEFPDDNAFGLRMAIEPNDFLGIELAAMDADGDWENVFDHVFFAGEFTVKPKLLKRDGNYRFYGWYNDKNHIRWDNSLADKKASYGFGLSFDQQISEILGVFVRYGWQDPNVYAQGSDFSLEQSWSAGLQLGGSLWGRDEDILAIAFGQVAPSDDYKEANSLRAKSEEHFEVYYSFKVNDHLTLSPDLQVIWNPYGGDAANGDDTIVVGGIRSQVDF